MGTLLALGSAISWSLANLAIQSSARRLGSWAALVWAQVLGACAAALVALAWMGPPPAIGSRTALAVGIAGAAALIAYAGLFESLRSGQVSVVTPVVSAWSVVSALVGVTLFQESLGAARACGIALVVIGNAVVARSRGRDRDGTPTAALGWALAAMIGFGCMVPAVEVAGAELGRLWAVPAVWAVELAIGVPLLWWLGRLAFPRGAGDWLSAGRAALFEAGGFVAISLALGFAPVTVVSPVSSLSTAGSVLLGVAVLRERLPRAALLGALVACAGVLLVNLGPA
jgi:drug/metabolite transporter (DMT)-like permease